MAIDLAGQAAVVTGAGRGIGRAIAMTLAELGAGVVVNDLGAPDVDGQAADTTPADEVVAEIAAAGGKAVANYDSVADFEGARRIVETAVDAFGRLDALVNNAGITGTAPLYELAPERFDAVVRVHTHGTFYCTRHAGVHMKEQGYGRILNVVSRAGLIGASGAAAYGAGKGGIYGFTNVAARDLAPFGITVNAINPAAALTRMVTGAAGRARERGLDEARARRMLDVAQDPRDVAVVAAYLCSKESGDINGRFFFVQGGHVGLFEPLAVGQSLVKDGRWTPDELAAAIPKLRLPPLEGIY